MSKVLKTIGLGAGALVLGLYFTGRSGSPVGIVSVYCRNDDSGRLARAIDTINTRLFHNQRQIRIRKVAESDKADVEVEFSRDWKNPSADATSYVYRGHTDIRDDIPEKELANALLHEILHHAGCGHETERSSVMYSKNQENGLIHRQHTEKLYELPNTSRLGRVWNQIGVLGESASQYQQIQTEPQIQNIYQESRWQQHPARR